MTPGLRLLMTKSSPPASSLLGWVLEKMEALVGGRGQGYTNNIEAMEEGRSQMEVLRPFGEAGFR